DQLPATIPPSRVSTRYVLAWLVLLGGLTFGALRSWHSLDKPERRDGNEGHVAIDFGGRWLMGRMLLEGHGRRLYDRSVQRQVLDRAFPREDEAPGQETSDVDELLSCLMGNDSPQAAEVVASFASPVFAGGPLQTSAALVVASQGWTAERIAEASARRVGGPLYPPLNAFVLAPLALLPPQPAYRVGQLVNLLLVFLCGVAVVRLSDGTVWWPVATLLLMMFPNFGGSLYLAQNATLSLAILVWGWVLLTRGHEGWAGTVWGLLAFKPVWAVSFFLVPVLTRR